MGEDRGALLVPQGRQWGTIWEPLELFILKVGIVNLN